MSNFRRLAAGAVFLASFWIIPPAAAEVKPASKAFVAPPAAGTALRDRLKNGSFGPEMVVIPAGRFRMGAVFGGGDPDEKPVHWVAIPRPFAMGKYEVTFEEYDRFCEATGREKPKDGRRWFGPLSRDWGRGRMPVMNVGWEDAVAYAKWLSEQTGQRYRLPGEAEWEYAARGGGRIERYAGGDDVDAVAWYGANSGNRTHPVGEKLPNALGLYDMSGNVWQWTADWYGEGYYRQSPRDNPGGASEGTKRIFRGGSWFYDARGVRASYRDFAVPEYRSSYLGFRLVRQDRPKVVR